MVCYRGGWEGPAASESARLGEVCEGGNEQSSSFSVCLCGEAER